MDNFQFDVTANLEDLIDDPGKLDTLFQQADEANQRRLWDDAEWTTLRFTSLKEIVTAFMVGTMRADMWCDGYSLPPNFDVVMNAMCGAVVVKFGNAEFCEASLLDLEAFYHEFIDATPLCREWNDFPGSGFISATSPAPTSRTFIDLDALIRNAAIYIRDDRRQFDAFNADFDRRHAEPADTKEGASDGE
jgi:hypothetical protein